MNQKDLAARPLFHNYIECEGKMWFWNTIHNGLFMCGDDGKASRVPLKCYEKYDLCGNSLYNKIILVGKKIIGVPYMADELLIYDLYSREDKYISVANDLYSENTKERGKFWDAVNIGNSIFLIGFWTSHIVKIDVQEEKVIDCVDLCQDMYVGKEIQTVYYKNAIVYRNKLLIPSCLEPIVFEVDIQTMDYSMHRFENMERGFSYIFADGDCLWLAPRRTDAIICWDRTTNERHFYSEYPEGFSFGNASIGFVEKYNDDIFFFPLHASGILVLNEKDGQIKLADAINSKLAEQFAQGEELGINKCYNVSKRDDNIVVLSGVDRKLYFYNTVDESFCVKDIMVSEEECIIYRGRRMSKANDNNNFFLEAEHDLSDFCAYILLDEMLENK